MYGVTVASWGISEGLYKGLVIYGVNEWLYGCISDGLYKGLVIWLYKCLLVFNR